MDNNSLAENIEEKRDKLTISDIEKVLSLFREKGSESELRAFIKELTDEIKETSKPDKKTSNWQNIEEKIPSRVNLALDFLHIDNISRLLKNKYFKKFAGFAGSFLIIYFLFNLPVYITRVSYLFGNKTELQTIKYSQIVQTPMAKSAPLDPDEIITPDSRLLIPKLSVNAPIVFATSQEEKDILEGLHNGVVRYAGMSNPGDAGNTYITGHSSNYWWDKGKYNYVFVLLDKMQTADRATIYHNGNKYIYEVTSKEIVEPANVSSLAQTTEPTLTLMTCYPPGTTNKRLTVRLKQISPQYFAPRIVEKEKTIEVPKSLPSSDNGSFFGLFRLFQ
ncbi:hypothetical protein COY62_00515 [bacterium (Candidatus Howlettbacteria) CG_4_10_14_0_8_um_filter_40_9]|nr:MAG: hypothetical protein COY62_00515 [bacterium (Candidatus Howlettbacteria) CG_4_10_14_0_8_um_filter_40_9]